ncbi:C2H2 finger domain transcription factor [Lachnellula hyalina]|uniref:C2H2 finger domain transcription factor n=1 Tax=Lachnellula hyalina TaxID=1316788 RepID=A0A8H8TW25_9HELO|nr:C2H2 finger domain transcription factor [Lachnellula hyalina]TVY24429.1 C2H2 finger domain transcription factor [Lachnellula hyalina]
MNLSSLVHAGRYQAGQHFHYSSRPEQAMASSLIANPYTVQAMPQSQGYKYVTAPQPPPSPPVDETSKCSLPSISSLLGLTEGQSPQEQAPQAQAQVQVQTQTQQQPQPQPSQQPTSQTVSEYRPGSSHQHYGPSPAMSTRGILPPTPPMQSEAGFDGRQSPSNGSTSGYSVASAPGYYFTPPSVSVSAINNVEPHAQRQHVQTMPQRRVSMPAATMAYSQTPFNGQYAMSPSQQSMSSYYSSPMQPTPPQSQISGLYYQRPLPQQFPPPLMPVSVTLTPSSGANPWQHHHYISPSSAASFPQSQDRYICQTCNKAFSRPSSLRIHSHSHTGEKPFKCPHQGCGKAFSVRSNMKRHERGCHSFEGGAMV